MPLRVAFASRLCGPLLRAAFACCLCVSLLRVAFACRLCVLPLRVAFACCLCVLPLRELWRIISLNFVELSLGSAVVDLLGLFHPSNESVA